MYKYTCYVLHTRLVTAIAESFQFPRNSADSWTTDHHHTFCSCYSNMVNDGTRCLSSGIKNGEIRTCMDEYKHCSFSFCASVCCVRSLARGVIQLHEFLLGVFTRTVYVNPLIYRFAADHRGNGNTNREKLCLRFFVLYVNTLHVHSIVVCPSYVLLVQS